MKTDKCKEQLAQTARFLMLHGSFTNNLGLLNGKMGIILFFYHYSKYTGQSIYRKFAEELIDELYSEITKNAPYNFADGLCGIAWGFAYLVRSGFVKTDNENDLLSDLDAKIMEWDVRHINDASLETGIEGLGNYVLSRFSCDGSQCYLPATYIQDFISAAERNGNYEYIRIIRNMKAQTYDAVTGMRKVLLSLLPKKEENRKDGYMITSLGLSANGCAGQGLSLIFNQHGKD
jgi:hypothetical protein